MILLGWERTVCAVVVGGDVGVGGVDLFPVRVWVRCPFLDPEIVRTVDNFSLISIM